MGAIWLDAKYADILTAGTHGSTFGGNALACAASLATLEEIEKKNLISNAEKMGEYLIKGLEKIRKANPDKLAEIRGMGLMVGAVFNPQYVNVEVCSKLRERGLILIPAGSNALRFLPPLTVKASEIDKALKIFEKTISEL